MGVMNLHALNEELMPGRRNDHLQQGQDTLKEAEAQPPSSWPIGISHVAAA